MDSSWPRLILKHLTPALIAVILPGLAFSGPREFVNTLPSIWKTIPTGVSNTQVFTNIRSHRHEYLTANVISYSSPSEMKPEELMRLKGEIQDARAKAMNAWGLKGYTIQGMSFEASPDKSFSGVIVIEASYLNRQSHEVQVIERQYLGRQKMIQVVYTEENTTVDDRDRVKRILENLKPRPETRRSAASPIGDLLAIELANAKEGVGGKPSAGHTETTLGEIAVSPDNDVIETPGLPAELCQGIPKDQVRTKGDQDLGVVNFLSQCGTGVWNQIQAADQYLLNLKSADEQMSDTVGTAVTSIKKYLTDSAYRASTNASIFGATETAKQTAIRLYEYMTKIDPPAACYKPHLQAQKLCAMVSKMGATKLASIMGGSVMGAVNAEAKAVPALAKPPLLASPSGAKGTIAKASLPAAETALASGTEPKTPPSSAPAAPAPPAVQPISSVPPKPAENPAKVAQMQSALEKMEAARLQAHLQTRFQKSAAQASRGSANASAVAKAVRSGSSVSSVRSQVGRLQNWERRISASQILNRQLSVAQGRAVASSTTPAGRKTSVKVSALVRAGFTREEARKLVLYGIAR